MMDWHYWYVDDRALKLAILKELKRQGVIYVNLVTGYRHAEVSSFYASITAGDGESHDEMVRRYPGMTTIEPLRIERQIEALERQIAELSGAPLDDDGNPQLPRNIRLLPKGDA